MTIFLSSRLIQNVYYKYIFCCVIMFCDNEISIVDELMGKLYTLMLESGANMTLISEKLAYQLWLPFTGRIDPS